MKIEQAKYTVVVALSTAVLAVASPALGEPSVEAQKARALYDEALRKMDARRPAEACPLLEDVLAALPDLVGAKLTLAECYTQTGRLASAFGLYAAVEQEAAQAGQEVRRKKAAEKVRALEPRLARLSVSVPDALARAEGLVIERDGQRLAPSQWGVALPVDRGPHVIEARLPGQAPWKSAVDVAADGALVAVKVELRAPEKAAPLGGAVSAETASPLSVARGRTFWSPQRVASVVGMGLGAVGLGIGIGFGAKAIQAKNESDSGHCDANSRCDAEGLALREESVSAGDVSTGMFVAGGVLLAGSTLLFVLTPSKGKEGETSVAVGPRGVAVRGTW
jgi:hypothetical protein